MTDLFAAAKVEAPPAEEPDTTVRWRRIPKSEGHYLFHPCADCGATEAHFGEGVSFRHRRGGVWRCYPCQLIHVSKRKGG